MENLETKQIILQLEKQDQDLSILKKHLYNLIQLTKDDKTKEINKSTLKIVRAFIEQHNLIVKQISEAEKTMGKIKAYFSGIFDNLPLNVKHQFILKGKIKWQLYLLTAFLGLIITLSSICYHNYKDNTNYEKAWKLMLNEDLSENQTKYLNSFLEKAEEKN